MFAITARGLKPIKAGTMSLEPNTIHYYGASYDPRQIIIKSAGPDCVEFWQIRSDLGEAHVPWLRREQRAIFEHLCSTGDATKREQFKSHPGFCLVDRKVEPLEYIAGLEWVTVHAEAIAAPESYPLRDAWYAAEEYGNVSGLPREGASMLYMVAGRKSEVSEIENDSRFRVIPAPE